MEKNQIPSTTPFPRVIKALGEGFNLVAGHARLMLIPLLLDIALLFGPKIRITNYFQPFLNAVYSQIESSVSRTVTSQLDLSFDVLSEYLGSINLLGFIQSVPVGVSVVNGVGGAQNPLGTSASVEIMSIIRILLIIIAVYLVGILLGTLYYALIAKSAAEESSLSIGTFGKQLLNTILLYMVIAVILMILAIPFGCIITFSMLSSPLIYQIFLFLFMVFICWMIVPVFLVIDGIFISHMDFPQAVKQTFSMMSWSSPIAVRYLLYAVVISLGLDLIWSIPKQSSWLILISVFGHAFITTSLLAGSFILFRQLTQWGKDNQEFLQWRKSNPRFSRIIKKEHEQHD